MCVRTISNMIASTILLIFTWFASSVDSQCATAPNDTLTLWKMFASVEINTSSLYAWNDTCNACEWGMYQIECSDLTSISGFYFTDEPDFDGGILNLTMLNELSAFQYLSIGNEPYLHLIFDPANLPNNIINIHISDVNQVTTITQNWAQLPQSLAQLQLSGLKLEGWCFFFWVFFLFFCAEF